MIEPGKYEGKLHNNTWYYHKHRFTFAPMQVTTFVGGGILTVSETYWCINSYDDHSGLVYCTYHQIHKVQRRK